jgi:uncharacterized protein YqgC (DUF456 family)
LIHVPAVFFLAFWLFAAVAYRIDRSAENLSVIESQERGRLADRVFVVGLVLAVFGSIASITISLVSLVR